MNAFSFLRCVALQFEENYFVAVHTVGERESDVLTLYEAVR
jgi:hypothetical protein